MHSAECIQDTKPGGIRAMGASALEVSDVRQRAMPQSFEILKSAMNHGWPERSGIGIDSNADRW
jgi:hypothetical protein